MNTIKKVLRMPYVPAALLVTGVWFAGSAAWYTCQTQELCGDNESSATQMSDANAEQTPVATTTDVEPNEDVVIVADEPQQETAEKPEENEGEGESEANAQEQPDSSSFDTTQTVTAFYAPNSDTFARTGWEDTLRSFSSYLKDNPSASVEIAGYAANVSNDINEQDLSRSRAQKLTDFLSDEGVSAGQITVVVKAYEEPIGDNSSEDGRAKNRRAVVRFK